MAGLDTMLKIKTEMYLKFLFLEKHKSYAHHFSPAHHLMTTHLQRLSRP